MPSLAALQAQLDGLTAAVEGALAASKATDHDDDEAQQRTALLQQALGLVRSSAQAHGRASARHNARPAGASGGAKATETILETILPPTPAHETMLPVVAGKPETLRQIVIYSALLAPLGVTPYFLGMTSPFYGLLAAGMGAVFMVLALRLYKTPDDRQAWALFKFSVLYLTVLFASLILDKLLVQHLGVLAILGLQ